MSTNTSYYFNMLRRYTFSMQLNTLAVTGTLKYDIILYNYNYYILYCIYSHHYIYIVVANRVDSKT